MYKMNNIFIPGKKTYKPCRAKILSSDGQENVGGEGGDRGDGEFSLDQKKIILDLGLALRRAVPKWCQDPPKKISNL